MFTGLIKSIGAIDSISTLGDGKEMIISADDMFINDIAIGDSISVNGVCSTAIATTAQTFTVQYLRETLQKTTMDTLNTSDIVNLEPCLTLSDKLGGHLVSGHIDGIGHVLSLENSGEWAVITIQFDPIFSAYLIPKGSIAIDGISLTVVDVTPTTFSCHLIPHTIQHTTLHQLSTGSMVNLEFDQVGKYLHRFYQLDN